MIPKPILVTVLLAATASVVAQRPGSWVQQTAIGIQPAAVQHRGKILFFPSSGKLQVYSAFTRRWSSLAVTGKPTLRYANDWLMVRTGSQITAFSSMRGTFETIAISTKAVVVNSAANRNDSILLVRDGTVVHAFSGLIGVWVKRSIASNALLDVRRDVAIVAEGTKLSAMSAVHGTWVTQQADGLVRSVAADGRTAVAGTNSSVYGFAAIRNLWSKAAVLAGSSFTQTGDVAVWSNAAACLAFSGVRGSFAMQNTGAASKISVSEHCAVAAAGRTAFLFSAPHARWRVFTALKTPSILVEGAVITLAEPTRITAYSALRDSVATRVQSGGTITISATVAAASVAASVHMFSALTGRWHAAPQGTQRVSGLARNGGLLVTTTGVSAFSARTGGFYPLPVPSTAAVHANSSSSILAVESGSSLHLFEPRRQVWLRQAIRSTKPLNVQIWRTALVATGSSEAYGFSSLHGAAESIVLPAVAADRRASSEVGVVITANHVLGFSAVPDLTSPAQFPEFRRMFGRGAMLQLLLAAEPRSLHVTHVGLPSATPRPLPVGNVLLGSKTMVPLAAGTVASEGRAVIPGLLPDNPVLAGAEFGLQALVVPNSGQAYVTRLGTLGIY